MKYIRLTKEDVGFDLDSVLNSLTEDWLGAYNKDYNDNLTRKDILSWETYKYVKPECGKKIYKYLQSPGFFRNLGIQPGSQEVTKWLTETGAFNLYVVTAYHYTTCCDKAEWLGEHFPWIPQENIMFVNDKGKVKLDYLVDDGPHNIEAFDGTGIVYDYPYNRDIKKNHIRIYDLQELIEFFGTKIGMTTERLEVNV